MGLGVDWAGWSFALYPDAGEGGGCKQGARRLVEPSAWSADPERSAAEAARRARAKIRRYCSANRLNRLGTLTYAGEGCHEPAQLRVDVAAFFRGLREGIGSTLPYLWVPQWHPGGHGLHVHFAVARFVPRRLIERAWGRGFVHIKLLSGLPVGSGPIAEARLAAGYLARYVGRQLEDERRAAGLHRYEVAQGFQPGRVECYGRSAEDVIERASEYMRSPPERVWLSASVEGWRGPPACWAQWA
jgi:hypothetical protein